MARLAGMKLRCKGDHFGWAAWFIRDVPGGYEVVVPCDLGDHYLVYDGAHAISSQVAQLYPTPAAAEAAITRWEQQEAGKE